MSPTKEVYSFQWTEALMLASGSYYIQFKVKQGARILNNVKFEPTELFTESENGRGAIMKPWQQGLEREDPVAFVDNEISIVLQTGKGLLQNSMFVASQLVFTCSKSTMEIPEQVSKICSDFVLVPLL